MSITSAINNLNRNLENTVSEIQETGSQLLGRLNETLVKNSEESINHATQAISEVLSQAEKQN